MLRFDGPLLHDLSQSARREWIVGNGIGGYASSTLSGMNTRRYHGLLVAALEPPLGRTLLVSGFEDAVYVGEAETRLSCNAYPDTVDPKGHEHLSEARVEHGLPALVYRCEGGTLEKTIVMAHGENTTVVAYHWDGPEAEMLVRPLIACRDYHWLTRQDPGFGEGHEPFTGGAIFQPYEGAPKIHVSATGAQYTHAPQWYYNFQYGREAERGLNAEGDLFGPGVLHVPLRPGETSYVVLSTEERAAECGADVVATERARRQGLLAQCRLAGNSPEIDELIVAADSFIVRRGSGVGSVLAGYHWFGDWGRDTMIALPGLTLATGRPDVARQVLATYAQYVDEGMLPNRFPDSGDTPDYNTVDATLWYFVALHHYLAATDDTDLARELFPALREIIECHVAGTRYGIRLDHDGLLEAGDERTQLTWMDAKVGDWVVTPRNGKPVEISALWFNAAHTYSAVARRIGETEAGARGEELAARTAASFAGAFYDENVGYLADRICGEWRDMTLRPNQLFAASLPHKLVTPSQASRMLEAVKAQLLTPVGLRSLAPAEPGYRSIYMGDQWSRDGAYHQGTVWAWPIGAYVDAWLYAQGNTPEAREQARGYIEPLIAHTRDAGLGSLSEIFDAADPHEPRGCASQAWSVAEVLRVLDAISD